MDPTEAWWASARVAVDTVSAVCCILTRVAVTLINVFLALGAPKPRQAGTQKAIYLVLTQAPIATGIGLAVINVGYTVVPSEAWFAITLVTAQGIQAGRPIVAGILHTLINVDLTGLALPSFRTDTGKALVVL